MKHITRLEMENLSLKARLSEINADIVDLFAYLQSSKFHADTTVQVADIFRRLQPALMNSIPE